MSSLTERQLRLFRMQSNGLLPPYFKNPVEAVWRVVGLQAQDLAAGLLSLRARSSGLTQEGVEQAREQEHTIVWTWLMRGTLHLITAEDARWLVPLLGPDLIRSSQGRIQQLGWSEEKVANGIQLVVSAIADRGPLIRDEVRRLLAKHDLPYQGQAVYHIVVRAAYEGLICYGPKRGKQNTFALFSNLVGRLDPQPEEAGQERLALRYLEAYAPARPEDFAAWSGLKISQARRAFDRIESQTSRIEAFGQEMRVLKSQPDSLLEGGPVVRLLPRWDTFLLGYANRDLIIRRDQTSRIYPGGGIIDAVVLVDGQARGVWKLKRSPRRLEVQVEPFEPLPPKILDLIEAEVFDLGQFLGEKAGLVLV